MQISGILSMASCDLGVLMYCKINRLGFSIFLTSGCEHQRFQPPFLTWQPLCKSYVYCTGRYLASSFAGLLRLEQNSCWVRCFPSLVINSGPACAPRIARYGIIVFMGHFLVPVLPRNWSTPWWKGSVLDCFILSCSRWGNCLLSTSMSRSERCWVGS